MALFESYERRIKQINEFLNANGIASIEEAEEITKSKASMFPSKSVTVLALFFLK